MHLMGFNYIICRIWWFVKWLKKSSLTPVHTYKSTGFHHFRHGNIRSLRLVLKSQAANLGDAPTIQSSKIFGCPSGGFFCLNCLKLFLLFVLLTAIKSYNLSRKQAWGAKSALGQQCWGLEVFQADWKSAEVPFYKYDPIPSHGWTNQFPIEKDFRK